jgi:hypothetical protein
MFEKWETQSQKREFLNQKIMSNKKRKRYNIEKDK